MKFKVHALLAVCTLMFASVTYAKDVNLPRQHVRVCAEKGGVIAKSSIQLSELTINGVTSGASTFSVNTNLLHITGDVHEANVRVRCRGLGREEVDLILEQNEPEHIKYHVTVVVTCRPC